ncbi:hypothetical protein EJB05_44837, partial [Eragrostis curvula]
MGSSSALFFLFLLLLSAAADYAPARVRVGVILDIASVTGMRLQTSILMAVDDYYSAHPNSSTRIELHFRDSPGDAAGAVSAAEDLIRNAHVHAIIGPQTAAETEFVAAVGSRSRVPVLSFSATAPPMSPSGRPFLVRTCADDASLAAAVAGVMGKFAWRRAFLLHEDSPSGSAIVTALADAVQEVGASVVGRAAVPAGASDDQLDAALLRVMAKATTRVVVVQVSDSRARRRLFRRAKKAGMMSRGYVWIATSDSAGDDEDDERMKVEDMDAMHGVLVVRPHVQPTARAVNFAARFKMRLQNTSAGARNSRDPTLSMLWAYDTAWAVAAAAEAASTTSPAFATPPESRAAVSGSGATLLNAVLATTFDGLTGKFRLVEGQLLHTPAYEIVNVVADSGARTVGYWTEGSRITQDLHGSSLKGLKPIVWPGERGSSHSGVPKGWAVAPTGRELVIAVPVKHGFNQFVDVSGDSTSGTLKVTGYCIDVFDAVMKALPVSYRYVPFNGSSTSYDELVRLVAEQKADAVVGDVTITSSRMGEVDYTMPFTGSGWSMVVAVQRETSTSMFFFLKPLTPSLWFASFAFFVFTGFVVWAIEHRVNPEFRGTPAQQFGLIFYYAFSTLVFAHREKLESNLSRFVVIVWVFVVLILTSSYTASLTSMLTVQELRPAETDVAELVRRGDYVGYQEGSFVPGELKKMGFHEGKLRSYSTPDQYADALNKGSANGGVAAVFDEIPYLKLFLSQYCDGFAMAGPVYNDAGFGFVFPRGSPMVPDVSREIVSLTESDDLALIERKWFGTPGACDGRSDSMGSSGSLSFWSFSGLFLVTGVASGFALVVYLATFVYRERDELRAAESGAGSVSLRRLRAWLQHYDRKDTRCRTFKHSDDDGSARNVIDAMQKQGAVTDEAMRKSCFSGSDDSAMAADSPTEEKVENEVRSPAIKRPMEEANAALATQGKPSLKFLMNARRPLWIERKWFGRPGACDRRRGAVGSSGSLSFWSFSGLFLVTGVASGLALVVYLTTFVYQERDELGAAKSGARSVSLRRLRAWLQHYDRKDLRCHTFKHRDDDGSARNGIDAKQGTVTDEAMRGSDDSHMAADSLPEEKVEND